MCFVDEKSLNLTYQLKEKVSKQIKHFQHGDISWANIFVMYVTDQNNQIDLRIQKALLNEMLSMLESGEGEKLDSNKYRDLYIARVYENKDANNRGIGQGGYDMNELKETLIVDCRHIHQQSREHDIGFEKEETLIFERIGLSTVTINKGFFLKFLTIQTHLFDNRIKGEHPVYKLIKKFRRNLHYILVNKTEKELKII